MATRRPVLTCAAVLLWAATAHATNFFLSGCDLFDDATSTTTDSYEFTEVLVGGAVDADIRLQTAVVHDDASGGDSSSKGAVRAEVTVSGRSAYYRVTPTLTPTDPSVTAGCSLHAATLPSTRRAVAVMMDNVTTDPGCAVVLNSTGTLTLAYLGGAAGSEGTCTTDGNCGSDEMCFDGANCRKVWGTTTDTLPTTACSTDPTIPCSSAGDCPGVSPTCDSSTKYWAGIELGETSGSNQVICELYLNGRAIFVGEVKTIAGTPNPVGAVATVAFGMLEFGTTTSTGLVYVDDVALDESGKRAGFGYVGRKAPSGDGDFIDWNAETCGGGADWTCLDDYNVSAFVYDAGATTNNVLRTQNKNKVSDVQLTPPISLSNGEAVTAIEGVIVGRGATTGTGRRMSQSLLGLSGSAWIAASGPIVAVPDTTTVQVLTRYLSTMSPVPGASTWNPNAIRLRITNQNTTAGRNIYVGAMLVYVRVAKPDAKEPISLRNHNKGAETGGVEGAGVVTIAAIGDSTLGGTLEMNCIGGTNEGALCGQPSYCRWDALSAGGAQDHPPGGCLTFPDPDLECRRCTGNRDIHCEDDADCTGFGTCDLTNDVCDESCPGGYCPVDRVGWAQNLPLKVGADIVLVCGIGGEDAGEMLTDRFADIVDGRGTASTACFAIGGSGICTCSTGSDCGSGGTCTNGLCAAAPNDPTKTQCAIVTDCTTGTGQFCQFPKPDYLVLMEDYNSQFAYGFHESGAPLFNSHDPECVGQASFIAEGSGTMVKHCPQYGASGYARPLTACGKQSDCAGISATSECLGSCIATPANNCSSGLTCQGPACTVNAPACEKTADCDLGRTCTTEQAFSPGVMPTGFCLCTSDATCPANFACVGDASGHKLCRRTCATDPDCGAGSTCDTTMCDTADRCSSASVNFCTGRCNVPCDAVSCANDGDCGGTLSNARWGGLRTRWFRGTCNVATGKCACCGTIRCSESGDFMRRGCSCTTGTQTTDCGPSGVCTNGVCTANDGSRLNCGSLPGRLNCLVNNQCATGRQCMRCSAQAAAYERGHYGLYGDVVARMVSYIASLGDSTPPVVLASEIPLTNGLQTNGVTTADRACFGNWPDRAYYASSLAQLQAVLPPQRIIRQTAFNERRMAVAYHSDQVHFSSAGSIVVGSAVGDVLNLLNVCVKTSDGTAQKYCRAANGTFPSDVTCVLDTDCSAGLTCSRRKCDQDNANCAATGDSCGGD